MRETAERTLAEQGSYGRPESSSVNIGRPSGDDRLSRKFSYDSYGKLPTRHGRRPPSNGLERTGKLRLGKPREPGWQHGLLQLEKGDERDLTPTRACHLHSSPTHPYQEPPHTRRQGEEE